METTLSRRLLKGLNEEAKNKRAVGGASKGVAQGVAVRQELLDLDSHETDLLAHVSRRGRAFTLQFNLSKYLSQIVSTLAGVRPSHAAEPHGEIHVQEDVVTAAPCTTNRVAQLSFECLVSHFTG